MTQKTVMNNDRLLNKSQLRVFLVTMGVWMKVGSTDEKIGNNGGGSLLIEHTVINSIQRRSTLDSAHEIDRLGGMANAFTSRGNISFRCRTLAKILSQMCGLLANIFLHSYLEPQELVEYEQRGNLPVYKQPGRRHRCVDVRVFQPALLLGHPLGCSILGSEGYYCCLERRQPRLSGGQHAGAGLVVADNLEYQQLVNVVAPVLLLLPAAGPPPNLLRRLPSRPNSGCKCVVEALSVVRAEFMKLAANPIIPQQALFAYQKNLTGAILLAALATKLLESVRLAATVLGPVDEEAALRRELAW